MLAHRINIITMIRPWGCRTSATKDQPLAFHELEDDVNDNARVGRALDDVSSVSSDDDGTKSSGGGMSSTPMLGATPSLFTNFWSLSIPVLARPFSCRPTEPPRQSKQQPRQHYHPRQKRGYAQHQYEPEEGAVNISQEWKEAAKYLDSVIFQPPVTTCLTQEESEILHPWKTTRKKRLCNWGLWQVLSKHIYE